MRALPLAHGAFWVAFGMWPVVHLRSFEAVTGPKVDGWLVKTMGGMLAAVGASLIASSRRPPTKNERLLGAASAAVLAISAGYYGARGRIPRRYLADAAVEGGIALAWLAGLGGQPR